ncbi:MULTISPECIES: DUF6636 domain-containing protein [Brevibacterium]|uniref:DUF6636 domain-containing protein n=1 Tax=Brevibacterium TaxID=1696 RepID=UPI001EF6FA82|nr:DUF6636 domain-containing protein [Brevibacterium sp. ACRRH]MCG7299649.1 hypothetical protein [Brevibacterium sp. ACRRH]
MSNRDHERESLTRQLFVRPQTSDAAGESSQEATRSLSLEELQEMGRQSKTDDYSAPTTQFTPSDLGSYGPSIQSQRSEQPQQPQQPPRPPQSPPQQPIPSPPQQQPPSQPQPQAYPAAQPQAQPQAQPHVAQPVKPKRKVPGIAIAMMVVAVLAALGICGYIVFDQMQRSNANSQADNQTSGDGGSIGGEESEDTDGEDTEGSGEDGATDDSEDGKGDEAKDVKAFMSPSSNIVCTIDADRARCTIREFDYDPGDAPKECDVDPYGSVVVVEKNASGFSCVKRGLPTEASVLDYGETVSAHGFTCRSGEDGMTCESSEGHKFRVARATADFDG